MAAIGFQVLSEKRDGHGVFLCACPGRRLTALRPAKAESTVRKAASEYVK
jgi:hypothetical protein